MLYRFALVAAVLAPASAVAAPFDPGFALDGDPLGNALRLMAYGFFLITAAGFLITASLWVRTADREARDFGQRLRRRIIR